jgi:tetratricopeptide (TPR) repeat protein
MQKWGLIRPRREHGEAFYSFLDAAVVAQAEEALAGGATFRSRCAVCWRRATGSSPSTSGSKPRQPRCCSSRDGKPAPLSSIVDPIAPEAESSAGQYFEAASSLDDGGPTNWDEASKAYRRALEINPYLVPALINLANIHYARDEIAEAQALYERAIALEPDVFEAHFNLGNIFHDLGRYREAQNCYRNALRLNPGYADAHFYFAVTLEKSGLSQEARTHWRAYQQLAPNGEWVDLAREFSE